MKDYFMYFKTRELERQSSQLTCQSLFLAFSSVMTVKNKRVCVGLIIRDNERGSEVSSVQQLLLHIWRILLRCFQLGCTAWRTPHGGPRTRRSGSNSHPAPEGLRVLLEELERVTGGGSSRLC